MTRRADGGPAFPVEVSRSDSGSLLGVQTSNFTWWHTGLSLRDYFAAHAMQACVIGLSVNKDAAHVSEVATLAYEQADAMLEARDGSPSTEGDQHSQALSKSQSPKARKGDE